MWALLWLLQMSIHLISEFPWKFYPLPNSIQYSHTIEVKSTSRYYVSDNICQISTPFTSTSFQMDDLYVSIQMDLNRLYEIDVTVRFVDIALLNSWKGWMNRRQI